MESVERENSREALAVGDKAADRVIVLRCIRNAGRPVGASEIAAILHREITSIRPRVTGLKELGLIVNAGRRKLPNSHTSESLYVIAEGQLSLNLEAGE